MPKPDLPFNWIVDIVHGNDPFAVEVESSIELGKNAVKKEARSLLKRELGKDYMRSKITKEEIR